MSKREPDRITGADFRHDPPLSRAKAMRSKCLECCCGSKHEVKECKIVGCALWPWRMGGGLTKSEDGTKVRQREVSPEQRAAAAERMRRKK